MSKKRIIISLCSAGFVGVLAYAFVIRPWLLRWGATDAEICRRLPGDELVPQATSIVTRAITIDAPPDRVWPWIIQIGQGRGGFYSYTWLENLFGCQIVNAESVHMEWQDVKAGNGIRLHPNMVPLPAQIVEKNRALALGGKAIPEQHIPEVSWAFILQPVPHNATRLLIRWRSHTPITVFDQVFNKCLLEPIHFTMERKMMLGIKQRVEQHRT